jgi:hypothetical protein
MVSKGEPQLGYDNDRKESGRSHDGPSSIDEGSDHDRKRSRKRHARKRKRRREDKRRRRSYSSSESSDSSDDDDSSSYHRRRLKHKKKRKKKSRTSRSKKHKRHHDDDNGSISSADHPGRDRAGEKTQERDNEKSDFIEKMPVAGATNDPTEHEQHEQKQQEEESKQQAPRRMMVPMSKEEYEKEQAKVRQVYDPESGRYRLIRGSGEIIESIVSRSDHQRINQQATRADGASFSRNTLVAAARRRY